jgi:hypothetical protein
MRDSNSRNLPTSSTNILSMSGRSGGPIVRGARGKLAASGAAISHFYCCLRISLFTLLSGTLFGADLQPTQPVHVFNIAEAVRARTGRTDFLIRDTGQKNGRWTTLIIFRDTKEWMLAAGDLEGKMQLSGFMSGSADQLALDQSGISHVTLRTGAPKSTVVEIVDKTLTSIRRQTIPLTGIRPVFLGPNLFWKRDRTLVAGYPSAPSSEEIGPAPSGGPPEEAHLLFGFQPSNGSEPQWVELGYFSENITVLDRSGSVVSTVTAQLDEAYRAAGLTVPLHSDPASEITRISWAALARDGNLYICLSSLPLSLPAYIAAIEPRTGSLVKVIVAELPTALERVDQHNPRGRIYPIIGAVDDQLVITDSPLGLAAVYSLK